MKRLRLTKREAIRECKRLWKEIEVSGKSKVDFLYHTLEGEEWVRKGYHAHCPLCEYILDKFGGFRCEACPLVVQYKRDCADLKYKVMPEDLPSKEFLDAVKGLKE